MSILESIRIAFRGLSANKARSVLTMLGIIIGVGAVVVMVSIGQGASNSVTSRIQGLGSNLLTVMPGASSSGGVRQAAGTMTSLTKEDAEAIKKEILDVKEISSELGRNAQVVYGGNNVNTTVTGVTPSYQEVRSFHVAYGQFVQDSDNESSARVAVLGQTTAGELFTSGEDPIGKIIKIANVPFRVVGIMELKGSSGMQNSDDAVFIPLNTAMHRVFGGRNLRQIGVQVANADAMSSVSAQITNLLLNRHRIGNPNQADFQIMNQAQILDTMNQVIGTFTIMLAGIAAISLLVGGIGIMNIMLVSVTERTREIGLRKAVGGKRKDILMQFLIESLVLCLVGGGIGILLGLGGSYAVGQFAGWGMAVQMSAIWLAFLFSGGVGLFFGIYPAVKASRLSPIDALRYE